MVNTCLPYWPQASTVIQYRIEIRTLFQKGYKQYDILGADESCKCDLLLQKYT